MPDLLDAIRELEESLERRNHDLVVAARRSEIAGLEVKVAGRVTRRVASDALMTELTLEESELEAEADVMRSRLRTLEGATTSGPGVSYRNAEAHLHEESITRERLEEVESRALELIEEQEAVTAEMLTIETELAVLEMELATMRQEALRETERVQGEVAELRRALRSSIDALDEKSRATYERVSVGVTKPALARVVGGNCGSCQVHLARGELDRVAASSGLALAERPRCEECGRILIG